MIAVGVDTHKHEHVARALDGLGQLVGGLQIKAKLDGYVELLGWLRSFDDDVVVGIEGAGSYGAGLCELLLAEGIRVVDVERPRREDRRRGKSDEIDALLAARVSVLLCGRPGRLGSCVSWVVGLRSGS